LYPGEPGTGYVFENEIVGGAIPKEFIKPIENGIRGALTHGVLAAIQLTMCGSSCTTARTPRFGFTSASRTRAQAVV
jgi:translation elongation factor EF-G